MLEQITKMVLAIALANAAVAIVMVPLSYIASGLVFDGLEKLDLWMCSRTEAHAPSKAPDEAGPTPAIPSIEAGMKKEPNQSSPPTSLTRRG